MEKVIEKIKDLIEEEGISPSDVFLIMKTIQDEYYDEWLMELEEDEDDSEDDYEYNEEDFEDETSENELIIDPSFSEDIELEDVNINLENENGDSKTE